MQREASPAWRVIAGAAGTAIAAYGLKRIIAKVMPVSIEAEHVVTIRKSARELYALWTDLEQIPTWMYGVHEVSRIDDSTTHWIVEGPHGETLEYNAETLEDVPARRFSWQSASTSSVKLYSETYFVETSRGTEVRAVVRYDEPVGLLGVAAAGMAGVEPAAMLKEHLRHFKMLAEAGEVANNAGPSARREPTDEPGTTIKHLLDIAEAVNGKRLATKTRQVREQERPERNAP